MGEKSKVRCKAIWLRRFTHPMMVNMVMLVKMMVMMAMALMLVIMMMLVMMVGTVHTSCLRRLTQLI